MSRKTVLVLLKKSLLFLLLLLPSSSFAERYIVLFGGGSAPGNSQVSIELNTIWINEILTRNTVDQTKHIFYTDGNSAGLDVRVKDLKGKENQNMMPLARVFNEEKKNSYSYHSSHIVENVESTNAVTLKERFREIFSNLKENDELLLIYQGHGGYDASDTNNNYLQLWGGTKLTVKELEDLMMTAHPGATIRYVFPQCFSGAFSHLIYKNAEAKEGLSDGLRCGFLAQTEYLGSEGCTDSINTSDYRDYSSYFFSALDNRTISGNELSQDPDLDHDGLVTYREAHLYSLSSALSVDYSHSTSEGYLRDWQPWYLKWMPSLTQVDNEYMAVSEHLAGRYKLNEVGVDLTVAASHKLESFKNLIVAAEREKSDLESIIEKSQHLIQEYLGLYWPAIKTPYTELFANSLLHNADEIQTKILEHEQYLDLKTSQDRLLHVDQNLLDLHRDMTQIKKIFRMRKMARLLDQFHHYANESEKKDYERLLLCESAEL